MSCFSQISWLWLVWTRLTQMIDKHLVFLLCWTWKETGFISPIKDYICYLLCQRSSMAYRCLLCFKVARKGDRKWSRADTFLGLRTHSCTSLFGIYVFTLFKSCTNTLMILNTTGLCAICAIYIYVCKHASLLIWSCFGLFSCCNTCTFILILRKQKTIG